MSRVAVSGARRFARTAPRTEHARFGEFATLVSRRARGVSDAAARANSTPTANAGWSAIRCASSTAKTRRRRRCSKTRRRCPITSTPSRRRTSTDCAACSTRCRSATSINPRLVRGLDYYTHTVFEWVTDALGSQGTVCAGGRYDGLVEQLGGRPTPGGGIRDRCGPAGAVARSDGARCPRRTDRRILRDTRRRAHDVGDVGVPARARRVAGRASANECRRRTNSRIR